jgi:hypothetical protein
VLLLLLLLLLLLQVLQEAQAQAAGGLSIAGLQVRFWTAADAAAV